jgi:hypothetical protein
VPFGRLGVVICTDDPAVTVRVAALLVTLPLELLTTTLNCAPLSAEVLAGVLYVAAVAPLIAAPLFCHW